jgi:hypothetical protein
VKWNSIAEVRTDAFLRSHRRGDGRPLRPPDAVPLSLSRLHPSTDRAPTHRVLLEALTDTNEPLEGTEPTGSPDHWRRGHRPSRSSIV